MQYTDQAMFFGKNGLILLKSPISGILFIQVVRDFDSEPGRCSHEFRPVKTIQFVQGLYKKIMKS